jgi:hypothetical protein
MSRGVRLKSRGRRSGFESREWKPERPRLSINRGNLDRCSAADSPYKRSPLIGRLNAYRNDAT